MIDVTQLEAAAQAQGTTVAHVAYAMTGTAPLWWLGRAAYVAQRWHDVAVTLGLPDLPPSMRDLFRDQFNEACAAHVRKHLGLSL